jgi:hypothetical protein
MRIHLTCDYEPGMTATAKDRRPTMHEVAPQLRSFWVLSTSKPADDALLSSLPSAHEDAR